MTILLRRADAELVAFFTAQSCVGAQHYEQGCGGGFDAHDHALNRIAARAQRLPFRAAATLRELPAETREVIDLVYARGTGTFDRGTRELALDVDLLVRALAPRWGHGSFLWLVGRVPRAQRAHARRKALDVKNAERAFEQRAASLKGIALADARASLKHRLDRIEQQSMHDFLRREAQPDRAKETKGFFAQLVNECEEIRKPALTAFVMAKRALFGKERERRAPRVSRAEYIEQLAAGVAV